MTHQRRARAVVPGAHTFLSMGNFCAPHPLSQGQRTGGLHIHPLYLIHFLFLLRELVLLDFAFFST